MVRDVVRRIQADTRQTGAARINPTDIGDVLTLDSPEQQVVYRSLEEKITRTCATTGAAPVIYEWKLPKTRVEFRLETIGDSPGIAWITVVPEVKPEAGPTRFWQSSAAAPVGQGGTP